MKKILIWDWPLRLFHWTFACSLSGALAIGFLADDDAPIFQVHMLLGLVAALALVVRVGLGIVGSRFNRFSALPLNPSELIGYIAGTFKGTARRYSGHNPGNAVIALLMFLTVPLLVLTGAGLLGRAGLEVHEGLAIAMLVWIGIHLAGLVWHTIRHREMIGMAMITGCQTGSAPCDSSSDVPPAGLAEQGLTSAHPWAMLVLLVLGGVWVGALFSNHDPVAGTVRLPVLGIVLHLGDGDEGEEWSEGQRKDADTRQNESLHDDD